MTEYEQITIQVPTPIMNYLRLIAKNNNEKVEELIAYELVDTVHADLDAGSGMDFIDLLNLAPVFKEILDAKD